MPTPRRSGCVLAALAMVALAVAGCTAGSSSPASGTPTASGPSASSASGPSASSASSPSASTASAPSASASASSSPSATPVSPLELALSDYLRYTLGTAGAADQSGSPVTIGYVNEQGDAHPPGALASNGAQMAVNLINQQLGGIGGHPLRLSTCFTATAAAGAACARKFLADKSLSLIAAGGLSVSAQSFFSTIAGTIPVIDGVSLTPYDAQAKNTYVLYGDPDHVLGPIGRYATGVLRAKTASVIYPQSPGAAAGATAVQAGLKAAGVQVTMAPYPASDTNLAPVLAAAHASTAGLVVPYPDAAGCATLAKALRQQGITDPKKIVSGPQCLSTAGAAGLGDFPKWTYSVARPLYGDPTDPGMSDYVTVARQYTSQADAADPWEITGFGEILTAGQILNHVGFASLTRQAVALDARQFIGPVVLGSPRLNCGEFPSAPGVCNTRAQFFAYVGGNRFTKLAGWISPPTG